MNNESNDGDERGKTKEGNLDLSLQQDDADVFSEGIDSLRCVSYECIKKLRRV